jgi:hypothetical protein
LTPLRRGGGINLLSEPEKSLMQYHPSLSGTTPTSFSGEILCTTASSDIYTTFLGLPRGFGVVDSLDLIFFSFPFLIPALAAFLVFVVSLSSLSRITSSGVITRALVSCRLSLVVILDLWVI